MSEPILRWAGSKRKLLPYLKPFWQRGYQRYVEPFVGSACLFFALRPNQALLGDTNQELIETYETVRTHVEDVHSAMTSLPQGQEAFYHVRAQRTDQLSAVERAARFIYLNRFCFNGLYRTNLSGQFNVPYGAPKAGGLPSLEKLSSAVESLRHAELRCTDFEVLVSDEVRAGDLVYLDPPYAVENVRIFRQYGPHTFGLGDLERLGAVLELIDRVGASFVLSYADSPEAQALFGRWIVQRVTTTRNISGFAKHRRTATEVLITNFDHNRATGL